jgi:Cu+-exporting ATPase
MAFDSFRDFVEQLDRSGELIRISQPIATELEVTELADRQMKSPGGGKALLIEKPTVNGELSPFPVAINTLGSWSRMAASLNAESVDAVAAELGITRVYAELKPTDKARIVSEERARGRRVAMVGDGINDAPALAAADVGIAIGGGTEIALAAADIALLRGGIAALPVALALARRTLRTIRANLFWAFVYNLVGIPIAAGLLYPLTGWLLSPVIASAAMSLSSVSVLLSSLRLRRFEPMVARTTG